MSLIMERMIGLLVLLSTVWFSRCFPEGDLSEQISSDEHGQHKGEKAPNCTCGWTNKVRGRIAGGHEAQVNEYPYMAGLARENDETFELYCGATIITNHHAITTASCTYGEESLLALVTGDHDITKATETKYTRVYVVTKAIEHEFYKHDSHKYDIALLVVKRNIVFNQAVGPACLPARPVNLNGQYVKVTGWGHREGGTSSPVLMKMTVKVVPLQECVSNDKSLIDLVKPHQICTQNHNNVACKGDNGGPVTWLDPETNRYTLVGVVSYTKGCSTGIPGVSTDISAFIRWIQRNVHGE